MTPAGCYQLGTKNESVERAILDGARTAYEIAQVVGQTPHQVHALAYHLVRMGRLRRAGTTPRLEGAGMRPQTMFELTPARAKALA